MDSIEQMFCIEIKVMRRQSFQFCCIYCDSESFKAFSIMLHVDIWEEHKETVVSSIRKYLFFIKSTIQY